MLEVVVVVVVDLARPERVTWAAPYLAARAERVASVEALPWDVPLCVLCCAIVSP